MKRLRPKARLWAIGMVQSFALAVVFALLAILRPALIERGELWTYDWRARTAAQTESSPNNVVLIDISEIDLDAVDRNLNLSWPWPRELYGNIAQYVTEGGAKSIAFDFLFQDRGQFSVDDANVFAEQLKKSNRAVLGLALTDRTIVTPPRE